MKLFGKAVLGGGRHFKSDITAGEAAGNLTHEFLTKMYDPYAPPNQPPVPPLFSYGSSVRDAQTEWS